MDIGLATIGGAALSSIANLLGGAIGSAGQAAANAETMRFNAQQAFNQMDFQERMRNTAYQVAMYDMKKAGLNPILAANLGGAAVPSGAAASVNLGNVGASLGAGVSSAGGLVQRMADLEATSAQADKDKSVVPVNRTTAELQQAQTGLAIKSQGQVDANIANINADTANKFAQNPNISADTANKIADNVRIQADAVTAQRVAQDTVQFGASKLGQDVAAVLRMLDTAANSNNPLIQGAIRILKSSMENSVRPGSPSQAPNAANPHGLPVPGLPQVTIDPMRPNARDIPRPTVPPFTLRP